MQCNGVIKVVGYSQILLRKIAASGPRLSAFAVDGYADLAPHPVFVERFWRVGDAV